jgi:hypothetical protein
MKNMINGPQFAVVEEYATKIEMSEGLTVVFTKSNEDALNAYVAYKAWFEDSIHNFEEYNDVQVTDNLLIIYSKEERKGSEYKRFKMKTLEEFLALGFDYAIESFTICSNDFDYNNEFSLEELNKIIYLKECKEDDSMYYIDEEYNAYKEEWVIKMDS